MRNISTQQRKKNTLVAESKKKLLKEKGYVCELSHTYSNQLDLCHILPRSLFPEFCLCEWNMFLAKREYHEKFDNCLSYRQLQIHIFLRAFEHAPLESKRYFRFNK